MRLITKLDSHLTVNNRQLFVPIMVVTKRHVVKGMMAIFQHESPAGQAEHILVMDVEHIQVVRAVKEEKTVWEVLNDLVCSI